MNGRHLNQFWPPESLDLPLPTSDSSRRSFTTCLSRLVRCPVTLSPSRTIPNGGSLPVFTKFTLLASVIATG